MVGDRLDFDFLAASAEVGREAVSKAAVLFSTFARPEAPDCLAASLNTLVKATVDSDVKIGNVTVGQVAFPKLDDNTLAFRATIPASSGGLDVDVYIDLVFIQQGRATAFLTFQDEFSPFSIDDAKHYSKIVARRLASLPLT